MPEENDGSPEENDESPEGACCDCLGASDPEVCKAFFKAMLDAAMGPYAPALDLVSVVLEANLPGLADFANVSVELPDFFGWPSADLPGVSLPAPVDVVIPGVDLPGWDPEVDGLTLGTFFVGASLIPMKPAIDFVAPAIEMELPELPELPDLDGISAQLGGLGLEIPAANISCIAELLMFPVTTLQGAIDGGSPGEEDDEEDSEE